MFQNAPCPSLPPANPRGKDLLDLNFPEVIPAVGLFSLDSQLNGWLPSAGVQNAHSQTILPRFEGVGHIECGIENSIAGQPLLHICSGWQNSMAGFGMEPEGQNVVIVNRRDPGIEQIQISRIVEIDNTELR